LKSLNVRLDESECFSMYDLYGVLAPDTSETCALTDGTAQARPGDSGGPIVSQQDGRQVLWAVISHQAGGDVDNFAITAAEITANSYWINVVTGIDGSYGEPYLLPSVISPTQADPGSQIALGDGGGCGNVGATTAHLNLWRVWNYSTVTNGGVGDELVFTTDVSVDRNGRWTTALTTVPLDTLPVAHFLLEANCLDSSGDLVSWHYGLSQLDHW
jgi:hypothetical protein